jgi:putative ABC transport system permease protein
MIFNFEPIRIGWQSLRANMLRSGLSASGIAVGLFSVIAVMSAISGLQTAVENSMGFLGANVFQFAKYPGTITVAGDDQFRNRPNIDYLTYLRFVRLVENRVSIVCPKAFAENLQAVFYNHHTNPNLEVCGTNESFITVNSFAICAGRNLSSDDVRFARDVCLLGAPVADRLFPTGDGIGSTIRIGAKTYEVVGTLRRKGTSFGINEDAKVIIPITRFIENYGADDRTITVAVQARNQRAYRSTMINSVAAFRQARRLRPEDPDNFEVYGNDALTLGFRNVARSVSIAAFILSSVTLLASGVGIMNVMLIATTERAREIGLRRSLGARRSEIRWQFLIESLLLSLAGAIAGIALGSVAGNALALFLGAPFVFPWSWCAIGLFISVGIGIAFGFYPANKAAKLDPVVALRVE